MQRMHKAAHGSTRASPAQTGPGPQAAILTTSEHIHTAIHLVSLSLTTPNLMLKPLRGGVSGADLGGVVLALVSAQLVPQLDNLVLAGRHEMNLKNLACKQESMPPPGMGVVIL